MSNTQSNPRRNGAAKGGAKATGASKTGGRARGASTKKSAPNGHDTTGAAGAAGAKAKVNFAIEVFTTEEVIERFGGEGYRDKKGVFSLPGPGHDKSDRSMRLFIGPNLPEGFFVHSFAGNTCEQCRAYVRETLGLSGDTRRRRLTPEQEALRAVERKRIEDEIAEERARRLKWWGRCWDNSEEVTLGDYDPKFVFGLGKTNRPALINIYLQSRGLTLLDATVVRWFHGWVRRGGWFPGMLARIVKWDWTKNAEVIGYHQTFLNTCDGEKEQVEFCRGEYSDYLTRVTVVSNEGIIWLYPGDPGTDIICLGEGIETALSFSLLPETKGAAIVSYVNAYNLNKLPLPPHKIIYLAVDIENSGVGKRLTEAFAKRAALEGKTVKLVYPNIPLDKEGKVDLNDVIQVENFEVETHYKIIDVFAQTPGGANASSGASGGAQLHMGGFVSFGDFIMREDGLWEEKKAPNGFVIAEDFLSSAFKIIGKCRDLNDDEWGILLRFRDADGNVKLTHVAYGDLNDNNASAVTSNLARVGLKITPSRGSRVRDYIAGVESLERVRTVDRTGWHHNDIFVLPDETIGDCGGELVWLVNIGDHKYARKGTLQEWQNTVGGLAMPHRLLRLGIALALSGCLLSLVHGESGGLHLVCAKAGIGKTTWLKVLATVWGKGSVTDGYVGLWHGTHSAMEGLASAASDTLLALDEISQANADALAEIIYMLANERGKARMTANITMRATKNWRVAIASTGEKTVAQKVAESHGKKTAAGVEMRLISVSADAGNGHGVFDTIDGYKHGSALAMEMAGNATRAYGTAGPSFARAIIEKGVIEVGIEARRMIDDFVSKHTPKNASPQALRVAKRFGLIAAAGELAIEYNILLPWPKGCVEEAAAWAYDRWAKEIGANKGMIEDRQAVEQIRRLIEEYGDSRFDDIYVSDHTKKPEPVEGGDDYDAIKEPIEGASHKQYDERPVFTRYGYRRGEGEGKNWLVSSQVWREVFCKGFDPAYVAGLLAKQGKLNRRGKNLVNSFKINGKEHPGYILNSNILDNEEEENVDEDAA